MISYDLAFSDYLALPQAHFTALSKIEVSPLHYRYAVDHDRKDTVALRTGRLVHAAILTPDVPTDVAIFDGKRRAGKAWDAFEAENADRLIVKRDELEVSEAMRAAVLANPHAAALLGAGRGEVSVTWTSHGVPLRARLDWLRPDKILVELKSTRLIQPRAFAIEVARRCYHAQCALQADGIEANTGEAIREAWIIAVENQAPHDVAVYRLDDATLEEGRRVADGWVRKLRDCTAANEWPGVAGGATLPLTLPDWALAAGIDDIDTSGIGEGEAA